MGPKLYTCNLTWKAKEHIPCVVLFSDVMNTKEVVCQEYLEMVGESESTFLVKMLLHCTSNIILS